ncbi:alpha/beta hydrolase [Stenotrophomonas sp. Iso1]|uniref:alpha/beta fold hydrolase n=1 Tax=Stenotrophomonas sp. Iso1 TaxID=2977283 RepID=UPI0022B7856B|nr:alpha/beta hydrolase [Stenotrophomonas sp. Iso1]
MTELVILPGLDGTATLHATFIAALGSAFDSVHVMRYPVDEMLDYAALERRVRDGFPTAKPFVLLGESFSGPLAISIAADPPANMVGLILSTTFAKAPIPLSGLLGPLASFAPVRSVPLSVMTWMLLGRWNSPELEEGLRHALKSVSPKVLQHRAGLTMRVDVSALLDKVKLPTLYLRAVDDRLLSSSAHRSIALEIEHCTVVDVTGPHLLLQAAAAECAEIVKRAAREHRWLR